MHMTADDYRRGFRNGSLAFCMPAAHADISNAFLDEFSERILKRDWRAVSMSSNTRITSLLTANESEEEIAGEIHSLYGVDVSDLPGLPLWAVIRRCAAAAP